MLDRYEIGERATSACGIPTDWLRALDLMDIELQRFGELVVHTPGRVTVLDMPYTFSTFNYDEMCDALWQECDATFEIAAVEGRRSADGTGDHGRDRPRPGHRAAGRRRARLAADPRDRRWLPADRRAADAGPRGPSPGPQRRPRGLGRPPLRAGRLRVVLPGRRGAADRGLLLRARRPRPRGDRPCSPPTSAASQVRYQGNWIPHRLRPPTEAGVFFVGDSAGQCLPLTAEGIRTALYYGIAVGREMRAVIEGRRSRQQAARQLHRAPRLAPDRLRHPALRPEAAPLDPGRGCWGPAFRIYKTQRLIDLTFNAYLELAPPGFASETAATRSRDDSDDTAELSATQAA